MDEKFSKILWKIDLIFTEYVYVKKSGLGAEFITVLT